MNHEATATLSAGMRRGGFMRRTRGKRPGWEIASAESLGGREDQQDRVAVFSDPSSGAVLAVVADGLGGHRGGAEAAQAVVDVADVYWQQASKPIAVPEVLLQDICLAAHRRIIEQVRTGAEGGYSTCVLFYCDAAVAVSLHVGDSRIYRFLGKRPIGHSRDHSVPQLLVEQGEITEGQIATHPDQGVLWQALGGDQELRPAIERFEGGGFDRVLLCTDGLWESASVEQMAEALASDDLGAAARNLVDNAAMIGGDEGDNVTVALLRADRRLGGSVKKHRGRNRSPALLITVAAMAGTLGMLLGYFVPRWGVVTGWLEHRHASPVSGANRPALSPDAVVALHKPAGPTASLHGAASAAAQSSAGGRGMEDESQAKAHDARVRAVEARRRARVAGHVVTNGYGVFTWPDGRRYEGEWRKGKENGYGILSWPDGRRYEGHWNNNTRDGYGVEIKADGTVQSGLWRNNKFIPPTAGVH